MSYLGHDWSNDLIIYHYPYEGVVKGSTDDDNLICNTFTEHTIRPWK